MTDKITWEMINQKIAWMGICGRVPAYSMLLPLFDNIDRLEFPRRSPYRKEAQEAIKPVHPKMLGNTFSLIILDEMEYNKENKMSIYNDDHTFLL